MLPLFPEVAVLMHACVLLARQEIYHLQATVHQECEERTFLLEQLNALRKEHSLPAIAQSDLRRLAQEHSTRQQQQQQQQQGYAVDTGAAPASATKFPPIGRPPSSSSSHASSSRRPSRASLLETPTHASATGDVDDASGDGYGDEGDDGSGAASAWVSAGRGRGSGRGKHRPGGMVKGKSFH